MTGEANLQVIVLGAMLLFSWLTVKLVRYLKTRRINTELWCTVFEGLTQGAVRLDDLKVPEAVIEKKMRRDGKDKDSFDLTDMEKIPGQTNNKPHGDVAGAIAITLFS